MSEKSDFRDLLPDRVQRVINWYIVLVGILVALLIGIAMREYCSPSISLIKDEWNCTAGHYPLQKEGTAPVPGRGPVQFPQGSWICDRYERKPSSS